LKRRATGIVAVLLLVLAGIVFWQGEAPGGRYRPSVLPLGWTADGSLLFVHQEEEGGDDWLNYSCGGSGLYVLAYNSAPKPIFAGERWCESVRRVRGAGLSMSRSGGTLFAAGDLGQDYCGEVVTVDLARQRSRTIWRDCSGVMDEAAVSPDGRWVAALQTCVLRTGGGEPTKILPPGCVDGDGRLRITPLAGGPWRSIGTAGLRSPVWSPDARSVLANGEDDRIVHLDVATGEPRVLARGSDPAWSPDGRWIAFVRWEKGEGRSVTTLRIVRPDGTGERVLFTNREGWFATTVTRVDGSPRTPIWSPDGRRIVFVRHHHRGGRLWSVRSDGSGLRQLTRPMPKM
jgi:hypothetical protein